MPATTHNATSAASARTNPVPARILLIGALLIMPTVLAADAISTIYSAYLSAERQGAAVEVQTY